MRVTLLALLPPSYISSIIKQRCKATLASLYADLAIYVDLAFQYSMRLHRLAISAVRGTASVATIAIPSLESGGRCKLSNRARQAQNPSRRSSARNGITYVRRQST